MSDQTPDPYRSTHTPAPTRSNPSTTEKPWALLSEREIAEWRRLHPEATCSDKTARALTWLTQTFGKGAK
jgi:hypothetical protein